MIMMRCNDAARQTVKTVVTTLTGVRVSRRCRLWVVTWHQHRCYLSSLSSAKNSYHHHHQHHCLNSLRPNYFWALLWRGDGGPADPDRPGWERWRRPTTNEPWPKRCAQDRAAWRQLVTTATSTTSAWRRRRGGSMLGQRQVPPDSLVAPDSKASWKKFQAV